MKTLKPFQNEGVNFLTTRRHALLADDMGLGKTLQAIGALNTLLPSKVLIVCPASIKDQWATAIKQEAIFWDHSIQIVNGTKSTINPFNNVIIVNYDLLPRPEISIQLAKMHFDVGIYDEVHYCKSMDAKRTKAVFGKNGLVHRCARNIALTGTPILNRPIELFPMLKVLAPDVLGKQDTFEKFGLYFCHGWYDGYDLNVKGASNEEELNDRLKSSGFMLRRTEKDVALQLPEKRFQVFMVDGDATKLQELERLEHDSFRKQRFSEDTPIATLRRELAEKKITQSLDMIKDIVEQVGKIVIFAYHKSVIDILMGAFPAVKIDGSCSQIQRHVALKHFRDDTANVLIGQLTAAGTGLDGMQNVCSHILFAEIPWTPSELNQAIARVHRIGQSKSVLIQFLIWRKSVEEHQMRTILDKEQTINKIIN